MPAAASDGVGNAAAVVPRLAVPRVELLSPLTAATGGNLALLAFDLAAARLLTLNDLNLTAALWRDLLARAANVEQLRIDRSRTFALSCLGLVPAPLARLRVLSVGALVRQSAAGTRWSAVWASLPRLAELQCGKFAVSGRRARSGPDRDNAAAAQAMNCLPATLRSLTRKREPVARTRARAC